MTVARTADVGHELPFANDWIRVGWLAHLHHVARAMTADSRQAKLPTAKNMTA